MTVEAKLQKHLEIKLDFFMETGLHFEVIETSILSAAVENKAFQNFMHNTLRAAKRIVKP